MLGPKQFLPDRQSLPSERLGLGELALPPIHRTQAVEGGGYVRMIAAEEAPANREGVGIC